MSAMAANPVLNVATIPTNRVGTVGPNPKQSAAELSNINAGSTTILAFAKTKSCFPSSQDDGFSGLCPLSGTFALDRSIRGVAGIIPRNGG